MKKTLESILFERRFNVDENDNYYEEDASVNKILEISIELICESTQQKRKNRLLALNKFFILLQKLNPQRWSIIYGNSYQNIKTSFIVYLTFSDISERIESIRLQKPAVRVVDPS